MYYIIIIKLDEIFEINIHGNNELIEHGYDDVKGMKFYKLYFEKKNNK